MGDYAASFGFNGTEATYYGNAKSPLKASAGIGGLEANYAGGTCPAPSLSAGIGGVQAGINANNADKGVFGKVGVGGLTASARQGGKSSPTISAGVGGLKGTYRHRKVKDMVKPKGNQDPREPKEPSDYDYTDPDSLRRELNRYLKGQLHRGGTEQVDSEREKRLYAYLNSKGLLNTTGETTDYDRIKELYDALNVGRNRIKQGVKQGELDTNAEIGDTSSTDIRRKIGLVRALDAPITEGEKRKRNDRVLAAVIRKNKEKIQRIVKDYKSGKTDLDQFKDALRKEVKGIVAAGSVIGAGGAANLTANSLRVATKEVQRQLSYLDGYLDDVEAFAKDAAVIAAKEGKSSDQVPRLSPTLEARANTYAEGSRGAQSEVVRTSALEEFGDEGFERRFLGSAEHCDDCVKAADDGCAPIGTLPAIGDSQCGANCECEIRPFPNRNDCENYTETSD